MRRWRMPGSERDLAKLIEFWRFLVFDRAEKPIFEAFGLMGGFRPELAEFDPDITAPTVTDATAIEITVPARQFRNSQERERRGGSSCKKISPEEIPTLAIVK